VPSASDLLDVLAVLRGARRRPTAGHSPNAKVKISTDRNRGRERGERSDRGTTAVTEATWLTVFVAAAVAQLTVLPGEKVQFLISGLSTKFHPLLVVSAAGASFAGWTALEVWFGRALQGALPAAALDGITAALFGLFAVLLLRSAPAPGEGAGSVETDGGSVVARLEAFELPVVGELPRLGGFLPIFAMMATGEFGDKTQLVTIGLAVQYAAHPTAIWAGEMAAIVPVSLANAYFFYRFSGRFDRRKAHLAGAGVFAFFAADTVLGLTVGVSVWETVVGAVSAAVLAVL
jgi:putative Ca2+/H+ antiporter (TMEM165/GDT1 family)